MIDVLCKSEPQIGLRLFLCSLLVDSLHLSLFFLDDYTNIDGIGWWVG